MAFHVLKTCLNHQGKCLGSKVVKVYMILFLFCKLIVHLRCLKNACLKASAGVIYLATQVFLSKHDVFGAW